MIGIIDNSLSGISGASTVGITNVPIVVGTVNGIVCVSGVVLLLVEFVSVGFRIGFITAKGRVK